MVASDKYKWLLTYKDYKLAAFIAPEHRKVIDFLFHHCILFPKCIVDFVSLCGEEWVLE